MDADRQLVLVSLAVSALSYAALSTASSLLPLFDKSPLLLSLPPLLAPLLRWDSFHFLHIANKGYLFEHEWVFLPGPPAIFRYLPSAALFVVLLVVACDTSRTLYQLSLRHLQSPSLAYITVILSLLSTSPVTVRLVPYSEPFFTYLSYKGMLYSDTEKWLPATIMFMLASAFRSNGFLLSGYIIWGVLVRPFLTTRKVTLTALGTASILTALIFLPFIYHNYVAYTAFCKSSSVDAPAWCASSLPCIYTYSQSKYWDVGFLRYWSLSQLPNFIIASPVYFLVANYAIAYVKYHLSPTLSDPALKPFYTTSILPYLIHSIIFFLMLLTNAHTQIALRLAPSIPLIYWSAARLIAGSPRLQHFWISWATIWGVISIILWATFLPPA